MSDSLRPHELQHAWLPCPLPTAGPCSNSCLSSRWCHPTGSMWCHLSEKVVPLSSCLQSFLASGSFPVRQFLESGVQSVGASTSLDLTQSICQSSAWYFQLRFKDDYRLPFLLFMETAKLFLTGFWPCNCNKNLTFQFWCLTADGF